MLNLKGDFLDTVGAKLRDGVKGDLDRIRWGRIITVIGVEPDQLAIGGDKNGIDLTRISKRKPSIYRYLHTRELNVSGKHIVLIVSCYIRERIQNNRRGGQRVVGDSTVTRTPRPLIGERFGTH
jgi:hypothetical protein